MNATLDAQQPSVVQPASGQSVAALVLGLMGLLMCQLLSPIAWYLGWAELRSIRAGQASAAGRDYATIGMVLGIVGSAIVALGILVVVGVIVVVFGALGIAAASS